MLKRKAEAAFEAWKDDRRNEALLVMGARQVGKTYLIDEFAHRAFAHVVKFDLIDQADVLAALNNVRTSQELFMVISAYAGADLVPHETVCARLLWAICASWRCSRSISRNSAGLTA